MKTLKQLAFFLLLGSSAFLTSCGKDDPDVPVENKPTITIAADNKTAAPGQSVKLTINAAAQKQLRNIKLTVSAGGATAGTILDTTFASGRSTSGPIVFDYLVGNAANYTFTATVTDRDNQTASATEVVTVSGTGANAQICSNVILGAQSNATYGSSFNTSNCAVYKKSEANTNSAMVDLVYFYGSTNMATIAAPNDNSFGTGSNQISAIGVQDWSTKNATMFKKLSSSFDFSGVTDMAGTYNNAGGTESSKANILAVGDTYAFKTAGGKYGVFRVKSISGAQNGYITIDTKTSK